MEKGYGDTGSKVPAMSRKNRELRARQMIDEGALYDDYERDLLIEDALRLYMFPQALKQYQHLSPDKRRMAFRPDLISDTCAICGKPATDKHHVIGRNKLVEQRELRISPLISVCGMGAVAGCHGLIHDRMLRIRWNRGQGQFEYEKTVKNLWILITPFIATLIAYIALSLAGVA